MKVLLTDIQTHLTAAVPALMYIDEDRGQLDYLSGNPPVAWPCALIDCINADWSNLLHKVQTGTVQVKIRVADLAQGSSSNEAPQQQEGNSFAIFDLLKDIHVALHGWAGHKDYSALIRTANGRIIRDDNVRIYEVTYTTELVDNSTEVVHSTFKFDQTM